MDRARRHACRGCPEEAYDKGFGNCGRIEGKGDGCRPFISFSKTRGGGIYGEGIIDGQGGALMVGTTESWWQLARRAQAEGGYQNVPRLIQIDHAHDITFHGITLRNAPNFHVAMNRVEGATFGASRSIQRPTPAIQMASIPAPARM